MILPLSVIVPIYNEEKYLDECLDCLLNQTFGDFELLLINDGSTDASKDIALSKNDNRIKYFENKNNQGIIKSSNKGLYFAQGKYIAKMDADDICDLRRFETQYNYLENNPATDILGTRCDYLGTGVSIRQTLTNEENRIRLLWEPVVLNNTVMMRRETLRKNNLYYDKNALYTEDYKFWVDASLSGLVIENISDCLCSYRQHPAQTSKIHREEQWETANIIRLGYANHFFSTIIKNRQIQYLRFILEAYPDKINNEEFDNYAELATDLCNENKKYNFFSLQYFDDFITMKLQKAKSDLIKS